MAMGQSTMCWLLARALKLVSYLHYYSENTNSSKWAYGGGSAEIIQYLWTLSLNFIFNFNYFDLD